MPSSSSDHKMVLAAAVGEASVGLVAIAIGWWRGVPPLEFIDWNWSGVAWGVAAIAPMVLLLLWLVHAPIGPLKELKSLVDRLTSELFAHCSWWHFALIATAAGFGEELLFRGVIQEWLGTRLGTTGGLLAASLIFGLAHPLSRMYVVLAALIGVYLGWLWIATGNLLAPIVAHALYDFVALVYLQRAGRGATTESTMTTEQE